MLTTDLTITDRRIAYAEELEAFKPETLWVMLQEAVEKPDQIPAGFEWRVDVIRCQLIFAEMSDPYLRFEHDPSCWGLTGEALRDGIRTSARGGQYHEEGAASVERAFEYFELLAEQLRLKREIAACYRVTDQADSEESTRTQLAEVLKAQFRMMKRACNDIVDRARDHQPDTVLAMVRERMKWERGREERGFGHRYR